jgi:hypothetical protein
MADRIFMVRMNLDDLAAELLTFDSDEERGQWLAGFQVGASGSPGRDSWSESKQSGWGFGSECYAEAQEFRATKARGGRASAEARKASSGSAQPVRNTPVLEQTPNDARTQFEHTSEHALEQTPNQPTANSQQPTTPNLQSTGARVPASEWEPLHEHRALCAVRNADCDIQLSRFRERNVGQTDTDQGWGVRFMQWLGRAKPERSVPAEAVASPTLDQWIEEGKILNNANPKNPEWSWEACEAVWHENQAKGWRYVQDWKASIRAAYNRFVGQEHHFSNRRR